MKKFVLGLWIGSAIIVAIVTPSCTEPGTVKTSDTVSSIVTVKMANGDVCYMITNYSALSCVAHGG